MDTWLSDLKVEDDKLLGKRIFGPWKVITPSHITRVDEYPMANAFVIIRTSHGRYRVGVHHPQYELVVKWLREKTKFDLSKSFIHKTNVLLHKTPITKIFSKLLRKS